MGVGAEGEQEADSPKSRETDEGLDPKTLRSYPSQRQMLNCLSHPGTPAPLSTFKIFSLTLVLSNYITMCLFFMFLLLGVCDLLAAVNL